MSIKTSITYFTVQRSGTEVSDALLDAVKTRATELGIRDVVVASTSGETGVKAVEMLTNCNVVIVTHMTGFEAPGAQELTEENRRKIEANGGKILTATHVFMGVGRAIRNKFNTAYPSEIIAQTLRMFSEGTKVAIEITAMAVDAGYIPHDRDVIAIGGTDWGADTALVIKPANSARLFDLKVREIIAKPHRVTGSYATM